jgi:hypothetical protein
MYFEHLTQEHAQFLHSVLERGEAEVMRAVMQAMGRMPEHPKLGHRTSHVPELHLGKYLKAEAGQQLPHMVHRGLFKGYTDVLGNADWGDCGEAMALHGIEGIHHAAGTAIPPFVTPDGLTLYSEVGGFDQNAGPPGNNPTDQGTDNNKLVAYWENPGVKCAADGSVHTIVGSLAVNPEDDTECQVSVYEFGALFCAWALPVTAQGQKVWDLVGDGQTGDSAPGSWGYHDTVAMAYTGGEFDIDTWGLWTPVTAAFRKAYQYGFFVVLTKEMLNRRGVSPSGLDWTALTADFQKM